jgi:hypothetical protein
MGELRRVGTELIAELWREVGAAGEPPFEGTWVNFGGGFETAAFRKLPGGQVQLRGLVKSGVISTAVFTLPPGYRPSETRMFGSAGWNGAADVASTFRITESGLVVPTSGPTQAQSIACIFDAE